MLTGDGFVGGGGMIDDVGPGLGNPQAGDGLQQFLLAAAGDAGDAQNLPAVGVEGDMVQSLDAVGSQDRQILTSSRRLRSSTRGRSMFSVTAWPTIMSVSFWGEVSQVATSPI